MSRRIIVTAEVQVPKVPNFLRMTDGQALPVGAVSDMALREIGKEWTKDLIQRAKEQRAEASTPAAPQGAEGE